MNESISQHFLLPTSVPTAVLWLLTLLLTASWVRLRSWDMRTSHMWLSVVPSAVRSLLCFAALLALAQALQRHLVFATNWSLWPILLAGAVAAELVLVLYAFERMSVPRREGVLLASARTALVLVAVFALCQPVRVFETTRKIDRHVAVLIDQSASMDVPDTGMSPAERVRMAEFLSLLKTKRLLHSEELAAALRLARQETAAQSDGLTALSQLAPRPGERTVEKLRPTLDAVRRTHAVVAAVSKTISSAPASGAPLSEPIKAKLSSLAGRITSDAVARLDERIRLVETVLQVAGKQDGGKEGTTFPTSEVEKINENGRRVMDALQEVEKELLSLADEMDAVTYAALPEAERASVDALVKTTRSELAARVLTTPLPGEGEAKDASLLQRLSDSYGLKAYSFASAPAELDQRTLAATDLIPSGEARRGPASMRTDLTAALEKAMADIPPGQLAGVLLLSDGRHNGLGSVETAATRLGQARAPVCALAFGGVARPPKDVALTAVEAPDTVYLNDRLSAEVELKLDSLAGGKVTVKLIDGTAVVDTKTIEVKGDSIRERVRLSDKPKAVGYHAYKVAVDPVEGEVDKANNERAIPVNVTDDRLKVLYVEGRPRWEFRYLKNLFVSRDQSVRFQYVLLSPDKLENQPPRPVIPASASRPIEEPEATALPATMEEWLKFDVVLLGDVDPFALGEAGMTSIRKFVAERGGALALIAGPSKMPRMYDGTPLAELIPAVVRTSDVPFIKAPEESYRIALTQEGRTHPLTRLAEAAEAGSGVWDELPPLYWRHPIVTAKPGSAVLAYAMPFDPPRFLVSNSATEVPDDETLRLRRQFELENALIVCQNYALGRVVLLTFDESWRLRYRTGDLYHHKFWGQLLRWAASDKIMFGSTCVKVAADRSRYNPDEIVAVRARITRKDFSPVTEANPVVRVIHGGGEVARKKLRFEPNSPGVYAGEIGRLPEGDYKLELDCQGLPSDIAEEAKVARSEFGVAAASPAELVELAADLGLLNRIAALTGGIVAEPTMARTVIDRFGPPSLTQTERRQIAIWNSWALLLVFICLAGTEWLLRKRVGLP